MTEEIINSDGSRNWQANILLDNVKRLEQERNEIQDRLLTLADTYQEARNVCKRLEQENKELKAYKDVNEDFKKAWDELNKKYTEVLKLAKENADSNEYCLQELEQQYNTICYNLHLAEKERDELKEALAKKIIIPDYVKMNEQIDELKQENRELKEENKTAQKEYWKLEQGNDFLAEKVRLYRSALEEIRNYCDRIEQGSVIGTQDCLINSIKNIVNYTINEVQDESK